MAAELAHWQQRLGLQDVAFYDDALLVQAADHLLPLLEELVRQGRTYRLHTPNGLHARLITREVAGWLKRANFVTLRLGVETTALGEGRPDRKLRAGELEAALAYLREAGFAPQAIGVYLLAGLPDQDEAEVAASIRRVQTTGRHPGPGLLLPHPRHRPVAPGLRVLPLRPGGRTPVPQQLAVPLPAPILLGRLHPPETPGSRGRVVVGCRRGEPGVRPDVGANLVFARPAKLRLRGII